MKRTIITALAVIIACSSLLLSGCAGENEGGDTTTAGTSAATTAAGTAAAEEHDHSVSVELTGEKVTVDLAFAQEIEIHNGQTGLSFDFSSKKDIDAFRNVLTGTFDEAKMSDEYDFESAKLVFTGGKKTVTVAPEYPHGGCIKYSDGESEFCFVIPHENLHTLMDKFAAVGIHLHDGH